ncbi:MAG: hypothetical protein ACRDRZ_18060 [Pseudonocardiaceae bacterium]
MSTHYHVATGFVVGGALLGFVPEPAPEAFATQEQATRAAKATVDQLATEQREQRHEVSVRQEPARWRIDWWQDGYERGRIVEVVECDLIHAEVGNGV